LDINFGRLMPVHAEQHHADVIEARDVRAGRPKAAPSGATAMAGAAFIEQLLRRIVNEQRATAASSLPPH
jgi:hypothetical protein